MIQTIYSNSYELLRRVLLGYVSADRTAAVKCGKSIVFANDTIVIPSEAVKDDVLRAFADEVGIASNLNLIGFSQWFGDSLGPALLGRGNTAEELEWMIWTLLNEKSFLEKKECARLRYYVEKQTSAAISSLARRITHLFVTYVTYRLDWVLEWMDEDFKTTRKAVPRLAREKKALQAHPDYAWQRALFKEVATRRWGLQKERWSSTERLFAVPKRWKELLQKDKDSRATPVHIFLPSAIPPLALPFLQALAKTRDIFIYLINPSEAYWFETLPKSIFDNWKASDQGNALEYLRRNAASQRALIERIWTFAGDPETDPSLIEDDAPERTGENVRGRSFDIQAIDLDLSALENLRVADVTKQEQTTIFVHRSDSNTVLQQLQEAILTDSVSALPTQVKPQDDSFLIVKAPNAAREIEAVLDWVDTLSQKAKENGEKFGAEDVLVVTPDIDAMAPVISAVLMNRNAENTMAYHIAGQSQIAVNSTAQAILAAGRFVFSKATREDFEALLDYPVVLNSWGCDENLNDVVRLWLVSAGYRWGFDAQHAQTCVDRGLAQEEGGDFDGTFERALERLTLGSRMRTDRKEVFAQTLPTYGNEAGGFDTVAKNKNLFDFLCSIATTLTELSSVDPKQSASDWLAWTQKLVAQAFPLAARQGDTAAFMATAESVQQAVYAVLVDEPISFEAFWGAISATLQTNKTMARASGRITFSGMEDFRWLPFKAIAVVGLNDGPTFPGVVRSEEFDLMTAESVDENGKEVNARRKGDRDSRRNNRNVFLDLLCSCRQNFLISYTSGIGAVEARASVVVQDLKALLVLGLGDETIVDRDLTVKLPASVYAQENFTAEAKSVQSRNQTRLDAVLEAQKVNFLGQEKQFLNTSIIPLEDESTNGRSISLREISGIVIDPDEWVSKVLGVGILKGQDQAEVPLASPLDDPLTKAIAQKDIAERLDQGQSSQEILQAYGLDPNMGMACVRAVAAIDLVTELKNAHDLKKRLEDISVLTEHLPRMFLEIGMDSKNAFNKIAIPMTDVYTIGKDAMKLSFYVAKSGRDVKRALVHFFAQLAARDISDMYLLDFSDQKKGPKFERWHSDNQELAHDVIAALLAIVNRLAMGPMTLASSQYESDATFNALWIGDSSRKALRDQTRALQDKLEAMRGSLISCLSEQEETLVEGCATPIAPAKKQKSLEDELKAFLDVAIPLGSK